MSSFTWLDYSERDRRQMLEVVDLFKEKDTRDELGLGSIRDAFADIFFPGTSTIMTRARYFLLVPWTYLRLEAKKIAPNSIAVKARRAETDLIEAIESSDDNEGNIGKLARTTLKRLPSSVYWQSLGTWGIRTFLGSQDQYHRSLGRYYELNSRHGRRLSERDVEHDDLAATNWHPGLIDPSKDFPSACSLKLEKSEAEYLRERIRLSPSTKNSLLCELVERRQRHEYLDFAWQHPNVADLPPGVREKLQHARNFSELMHGAALLYNLMLAEESKSEELADDYRNRMANWAVSYHSRSRAFKEWDRRRFWTITLEQNSRISMGAQEFVNKWWDLVFSSDPAQLSDYRPARSLVTERERRLKKALARIGNPRAQEIWSGDSGSAALEYRWQITQRLLNDIFDGLEVGRA